MVKNIQISMNEKGIEAKELDMNALCIEAAVAMNNSGITKHVQFISCSEADTESHHVQEWASDKLMCVTIEWVDKYQVADPKNFEAA